MASFNRPLALSHDENARFVAKPAAQAVEARPLARRALGDVANGNTAPAVSTRMGQKSGFASIVAPQPAAHSAGAGAEGARLERAGDFASHAYQAPELPDFDKADLSDPNFATDYVGTIYQYFRNIEASKHARHGYMSQQQDINEKMRGILIDWLVEVHAKFKLMPETMYLTVNLIDRYLELKQVQRTKLQLIGVTAMLLASKYEEIYAPVVRDFVYITDKAYAKDQILAMEANMLNTLGFKITVPTPWVFANRFLKVCGVTAEPVAEKSETDLRARKCTYYLLERTLQEYGMLRFSPSRIAASVVNIMLRTTRGRGAWDAHMVQHTGYSQEELREPIMSIQLFLETQSTSNLRAVYKKYCATKHLEVALTPFAPLE